MFESFKFLLRTIKNNNSYLVSFIIALSVFLWILSGQFFKKEIEEKIVEKELTKVRVVNSVAKEEMRELILRGITESDKKIDLKVEVTGRVLEIYKKQGSNVAKGEILLKLDINDKQARLDEAAAIVKQREIEYEANKKLVKSQYSSENKLLESEALLEAAEARKKAIKIELENTTLRAPFDGFIQERYVEIGDYLSQGNRAFKLISFNPTLFVGNITEKYISDVKVGEVARIILPGKEVKATVRYISKVADEFSRTFRVELVINDNLINQGGITGDAILEIEKIKMHKLLKSVLSLKDDGTIGVKVVENNKVKFYKVNIVKDDNDYVYVLGLPDESKVIIIGQEYVKDEEQVIALES